MPQSIEYSRVVSLFLNRIKGWITALVTQHSINSLLCPYLKSKSVLIYCRPLGCPAADQVVRACCGGVKDSWEGPITRERWDFPSPFSDKKASFF